MRAGALARRVHRRGDMQARPAPREPQGVRGHARRDEAPPESETGKRARREGAARDARRRRGRVRVGGGVHQQRRAASVREPGVHTGQTPRAVLPQRERRVPHEAAVPVA